MRWISPEKLGSSTQKVSTDFLKQNGLEVVNEWYHSPFGADLFFWLDGHQKIIKFQWSLLGQILEWSESTGLKTGILVERDHENPLNKVDASDLIQFDSDPLKPSLEYAFQVLDFMTGVPKERKDFIRELILKKPGVIERMKKWFQR